MIKYGKTMQSPQDFSLEVKIIRQLNLQPKKKLRGLRRRLTALKDWADSCTGFFPDAPLQDGIWYVKIPIPESLVDGPKSKYQIKRTAIISLLHAAQAFREANHRTMRDARVVALIVTPDIFSSSIDIFFDDSAFSEFANRQGTNQQWPNQLWTPLPSNRSLLKEWHLPSNMPEIGYAVEIKGIWDNENYNYKGEIWLIGDVEGAALSTITKPE